MAKRNRCSQCRKDRQKCEPENRDPGVKCKRCHKKNFNCSVPYSKHDDPNVQKCTPCRRNKQACVRKGVWPEVSCDRCIKEKRNCSESYVANSDPAMWGLSACFPLPTSEKIIIRNTHDLLQELDFLSYLTSFRNDFIHVDWFNNITSPIWYGSQAHLNRTITNLWSPELSTVRDTAATSFNNLKQEFYNAISSHTANGRHYEGQLLSTTLNLHLRLSKDMPVTGSWRSKTPYNLPVHPKEIKTALEIDRQSGQYFTALDKLERLISCLSNFKWLLDYEIDTDEFMELFVKLYKSVLNTLPSLNKCIGRSTTITLPNSPFLKEWGPPSTPLHQACSIGDGDLLKRIINEWPDLIHARNISGETPLHVACRLQQDALVKYLVTTNKELNSPDCKGRTPLMWAYYHNKWDLFSDRPALLSFIQAQCGVFELKGSNHPIIINLTPFHIACYHGNVSLMKQFIAAGTDVNRVTYTVGDYSDIFPADVICSPLVAAILGRNTGALRFLLENGADVHLGSRTYRQGFKFIDPISQTLEQSWRLGFRLLLDSGAKLDIALSNLRLLQQLSNRFIIGNLKDDPSRKAYAQRLHILASCCPLQIPLEMYVKIVQGGELELLSDISEILRSHGDQVITDEGQTLLHIAALHLKHTPESHLIIKHLVKDCRINPDLEDATGRTALHLAVECNSKDLVSSLLKVNASPTIIDASGSTPIDYARREWGNGSEILNILLQKYNQIQAGKRGFVLFDSDTSQNSSEGSEDEDAEE